MKITDVNFDELLTLPMTGPLYDYTEEEEGFFKKLFSKKKEPEIPFFQQRIMQFGRDELYNEFKEGYDAYVIKGAPAESLVVLTHSYLIIPEKEIFPLYDVTQFAIKTEHYGDRPYEQYAIDRFGEPYDPEYISEYENEEGFELARFNILLQIIDENKILYEYVFPMEVEDRKDFRAKLNERLAPVGVLDASDEEVMEGRFPDDGEC